MRPRQSRISDNITALVHPDFLQRALHQAYRRLSAGLQPTDSAEGSSPDVILTSFAD